MAKITLPTNYRDDILNPSADGKRKYVMSYNQDGTVSFEDITPYEQVGSDFGAGDINSANEAINESFDKNKLVKDLDTINALTQEGFAPDALAVKQLNKSLGVSIATYGTQELAVALASMCDNYMNTNGKSYNGRFKSANGWYSYNAYYNDSFWSGYITATDRNISYSFYRKAGQSAVLQDFSSGTYYDDVTETLYIQGGTSNYTYDSATQTLYIG